MQSILPLHRVMLIDQYQREALGLLGLDLLVYAG